MVTNCISAELDQFLLQPLISRRDNHASCMVEDEHAQVSSVVTTRTEIPFATTYQRPIRELGSSVQLVTLYLTVHRCHGKCRNIDLLEVQQPPLLGRDCDITISRLG